MNLTCVNKFKFDEPLGYTHSATVNLGDREAQLFVYSHGGGVDPGEELFHYKHIKPMHISLYEMDGTLIWHKELPDGVLPGIWWCPAVPFDMDKDGVDEIYFINNTGAPFSFMHRKLQRLGQSHAKGVGHKLCNSVDIRIRHIKGASNIPYHCLCCHGTKGEYLCNVICAVLAHNIVDYFLTAFDAEVNIKIRH